MVPDDATLLTGKSQLGADFSTGLTTCQVVRVLFSRHSSQSCSVPQTAVFSLYTGGASLPHSYCEWWSREEPCSLHSRSSFKQKLEAMDLARGTTCPGQTMTVPIITICRRYVILQQAILVRNAERTSYHQPEELGKGQKERGDVSPSVLRTSQNEPRWNLHLG